MQTRPGTVPTTFIGHSSTFSPQEAIQDVVAQAIKAQGGIADAMVEFRVGAISGRSGGIAGFHDLWVEIITTGGGPVYTTLAIGEEGGGAVLTTMALGEEGGISASGGGLRRGAEDPTTRATGEEGGNPPTTMATGEEGGIVLSPGDTVSNPAKVAGGKKGKKGK